MTKNKLLFSVFWLKILFLVIAWEVVGGHTRLGDTQDYLNGYYIFRDDFFSTAYMMSKTGYLFSNVFGYGMVANVPALLLSFYGIYYSIKFLEIEKKYFYYLFVLTASPSFLFWTSIHSKEAVSCFGFGVFLGYVIRTLKFEVVFPSLLELFGVLVSFYMKPHFGIVLLSLLTISLVFKKVANKNARVFVFVLYFVVLFSSLYFYNDIIETYVHDMPNHFSLYGQTTRENTFWTEKYDFYRYAPKGIVVAFVGPTISESLMNMSLFPFFIEGTFLFCCLFLLYRKAAFGRNVFTIYPLNFTLSTIALFMTLFFHYPVGVFNVGSAIRYRQNFYEFLIVFLFYMAFDRKLKAVRF